MARGTLTRGCWTRRRVRWGILPGEAGRMAFRWPALSPCAALRFHVRYPPKRGATPCWRRHPRAARSLETRRSPVFKRDFILVHCPSVYDFRERSVLFGPVSDMVPSTPIFEMYPLGFTTMSEYFERHGLRCKLYNLASFMLHKKGFDVEANLARLQTRAFGIDLHWMPHCHGSIEVARILKRLHPGVPIIFGGISASFYHEELIRYDCVDYVFRGDSVEAPELELLRRIRQADLTHTPVGDLSDIPNLTWKDAAGCIHVNPLSWVPDDMDAISMDYAFPMKGVIRDRDFTSYLPTRDWLELPGVREPHQPRLQAQLRDLRRQRLRLQEPPGPAPGCLAQPRAAHPRHRDHPAPRARPHVRAQ